MDLIDKADAVGVFRDFLSKRGVLVEEIKDYNKIIQMLHDAGKEYQTPLSAPNHNDFTSENSIWLSASIDGVPIAFGCAKLEDIGEEPLDSYWARVYQRAYPTNDGLPRIADVSPRISQKVGGKLVYFGDLYVAKGSRGHRANVRAFVAIGHLLCSLKWEPDWTYCLLRTRDLSRAANYMYGFNLIHAKPFRWVSTPPYPRSDKECAVFLEGKDLEDMISFTLDDLIISESSNSQ